MTGSYPVPHTKAVALFQQQLQWKTAFTLILWGFCLMMLQFQYFFEYAFLLPALGMVFTFLGFYRLRNENKAMHSCCTLSLIALFIYPFYLLATTLPLFIFSWFHWWLPFKFFIWYICSCCCFCSAKVFSKCPNRPIIQCRQMQSPFFCSVPFYNNYWPIPIWLRAC